MEMGKHLVSKHFQKSEFACHDHCGFDSISSELVDLLEALHEHYDAPITILSGCRCHKHNAEVGGARHSQHVLAQAADIIVKGHHPEAVATYLEHKYPDSHGIGRYHGFTHIDVRKNKARWRA